MMKSAPIIIDFTHFYSLTEGDKAFEKMLLQCTIDDIDLKIEGLRNSLAIKNYTDIQTNAHSLVLLSAIVGLPQIRGWSRTIAKITIGGILLPELEVLINSIFSVWPNAKIELIKIIKKLYVHS